MNFHLEFSPQIFDIAVQHKHHLFLIGSCFTEQIGNKLKQHKFRVLDNPNGILFNPISIAQSVNSYISNKQYAEADLFYENESWNSWEHHSRFSHPDQTACLRMINASQQAAHDFLKTADWLVITLGSAFVYELENKNVVANCHKVPTDKFNKKLLSSTEVVTFLQNMMAEIKVFNPFAKIIFTISPVRHLRDGFVENNRSKANLINAVHQLLSDEVVYFPAYELIIDDLRDYRFFAEDMVHPNYSATNYVWEKFIATCIDEPSQQLMKTINEINAAASHKPFNPTSAAHKKFLQHNLEKLKKIRNQYPYIDFSAEEQYFGS